MAMSPREHIEEIRKKKFKIREEPDPKNEDLHHAVNYLSAELYAKDVHFLMVLIQNAEDNEYGEGVQPSLEFVITSRDITVTGASATLLVFNNERGFSPKNVESICSIGRSTKKGHRKRGYIGEKAQPYIFSNGYQIRFNEQPCPQCKVGYIVPEWVDDNPTLSTVKEIYGGSDSVLPTTTIVLPLKPDKVQPVKQQLSTIHPEILLFLSKIKRLSVKEDN
ncbi:Protein NO VEIN [Camellia lanceoleosa]|uniref:Protein NO VEIN n=1 Tax=Camellia lanceoleosa TaxID=1840588 RepID=A0ACC0HXH2_9ERIC|nr:Protein NO VEIN [Camellia lanceoleosa]